VELPADAAYTLSMTLLIKLFFCRAGRSCCIWLSNREGSIPAFYAQQQRLEGKINPNGFSEYDASLRVNFPEASDSARAIVGASSRYYYFIKPYAEQGYSGAPVFGKFRNADNEVIYRFTGVIFAGQPATKQTWAIKGKVAMQYLLGQL
jgi:hypothetical protein